jgi:hypothetical protein
MLEKVLEVRCDNCGQRLQIYGPWLRNRQMAELRVLLADWHFTGFGYPRDDAAWSKLLETVAPFVYEEGEQGGMIKLPQFVSCPKCDPGGMQYS